MVKNFSSPKCIKGPLIYFLKQTFELTIIDAFVAVAFIDEKGSYYVGQPSLELIESHLSLPTPTTSPTDAGFNKYTAMPSSLMFFKYSVKKKSTMLIR